MFNAVPLTGVPATLTNESKLMSVSAGPKKLADAMGTACADETADASKVASANNLSSLDKVNFLWRPNDQASIG